MEYKILDQMFGSEQFESVFEAGCANGGLLADLKNRYPNITVGGNDITKYDIEKAKKAFPEYADNFQFHNINEPWDVPDKSFDIVFTVGVFIYMSNPRAALKEMLRVAKKKVIIAEPHDSSLTNEFAQIESWTDKGSIYVNIIRNYEILFKELGYSVEVFETGTNKQVIKCTVNTQNLK